MNPALRQSLAVALSLAATLGPAQAQSASIEPVRPPRFSLVQPYFAVDVPAVRANDKPRLGSMIKAGKLYLSAQDAVALALENNMDVEIARYGPITAQWRVTRAEAGGSLPGVPSGSAQANSSAAGQGVLGSQSATGVGGGGGGGSISRGGSNASISQIGPVTQNLDPVIQGAFTAGHRSIPQSNYTQSATQVLTQDTRTYSSSVQQGLLSGGTVSLSFNNNFLDESAPSSILNPTSAPRIALNFQHNLLRGFGLAMNARSITIARNGLKTADLNFKTQVTSVVVRVLNAYYGLVSNVEDLKSKQAALDAASKLQHDTRRQIEIGTLAGVDIIKVDQQVATAQLSVVTAQTAVQQQELQLKSILSRNGIADPVFAAAQIIPIDRIAIPEKDDLPAFSKLVETAVANRPDLALSKANITNSEISMLGTKNNILPTVVGFGNATQAGLSGTAKQFAGGQTVADPYFVGGVGNALGQVFRRNFPSQGIGVFAQATIHNRAAQADLAIDQLQLRQTQLTVHKDLKQAQVDVQNAVVAMQQARVRHEAAVRNRILAEQLLKAEERRFQLGASTPSAVVQQQRDLTAAQANEVATLVSYSTARIRLDQTLGTVLDTNHVVLKDVLSNN